MKKVVFILIIAIFALHIGNTIQAKNNSNGKTSPSNTVSSAQGNDANTVKLTKATFLKEIWDYENSPKEWKYKGDKPAIIDFYADWCGPCKIASPILDEVAKEYAGKIVVYKVDTQVERELAGIFQIKGIPAFFYIPTEGKPTGTSGIGRSKEDTKKMFIDNIEKLLLANK